MAPRQPDPQPKVVLASASPRRREHHARLGLAFEVAPADVDETPRAGEAPDDYVARVAADKAAVAVGRHPAVRIVAADTTVAVDGDILGKPEDDADARRMLERLGGRRHQVLTGTQVIDPAGRVSARVVETGVVFRALGAGAIDRYVASREWDGKAGAYGAQGLAAAFITEIHGSFTSVIGLPLAEIAIDLEPLLGP
jgi:septum formation protein